MINIIDLVTILVCIFAWPLTRALENGYRRKVYAAIVWIWQFFYIVIRDDRSVIDSWNYVRVFKRVGNVEWMDIYPQLYEQLEKNYEVGWLYFNKFLYTMIGDSPRLFLIILSLIVSTAFCAFIISKECVRPWLSAVIFISLGLFDNMQGVFRQIISLFIIVYAYRFVKEKKLWKYLFCIFIAFIFHKSAVFALPIYFVVKVRFTKIKTYLILTLGSAVMICIRPLAEWLALYTGYYNYYSSYSRAELSVSRLIIFLLCTIFILYFMPDSEENKNFYLAFSIICFLINYLQLYFNANRVLWAFEIIYCYSIPMTIKYIRNFTIRKQYIALGALLFLCYFYIVLQGGAGIEFAFWRSVHTWQ